ncbi:MAG: GTP cyclohydrolase II [Candidatus Caenarcaniphilales bacterium]|nr:GTP cyclohydrolase II [Candidatus Caenarcaniphilales bacterium]
MPNQFNTVPEAIAAIKAGKMVIVADNEDRENEGDLICAAELVTPEIINFMATEGRGLICMPISREIAGSLGLELMTQRSNDCIETAFTISIDGSYDKGVGTGISALDRANTIRLCMQDETKPDDLRKPGHIFPLIAKDHGVLVRTGQTESAVDLARLAGLKPGGVICEIVNPDGTMARRDDLFEFSAKFDIPFITVEQIIEYRLQNEILVKREAEADLPTEYGDFRIYAFTEVISGKEHLALVYGDLDKASPVLVRSHSECLTGDALASLRCDCRLQLKDAMERIVAEGSGVLLYLRQEGRGIGLVNKIKAYTLQDQGLDTNEANERLGFKADLREYWVGAHILKDLDIPQIRLLTNNPNKLAEFERYGIKVVSREPSVHITNHNHHYLNVKKVKSNHLIA